MATFSSGASVDADGQVQPLAVDAPAPGEPLPPDAAGTPAEGDTPPPAEPAEQEEEAAVSEQPPRATRPFVARVIRENERYRRDMAAQAAQIEYLTRQLTQPPATPPTQPGPVQPPVSDPTEPQQGDYENWTEYLKALARWTVQVDAREKAAQEAQTREALSRQTAQQQWAQREAEGRDTYEDYDEVVSRLSLRETIAPIVADTFRESEQGHALLYYLGQHPKDVQHLNSLSPLAAARWLGQLEMRVVTSPAPPPRRPVPTRGPGSGPPAGTPMAPVGTGGSVPLGGFRQGMSLTDYERMRSQERQRPR
jgi:hypothetical protein